MSNNIFQKRISWHARCLLVGNIEEIIHDYKTALPIFVDGRTFIIEDANKLRKTLQLLRRRLLSEGVVKVEAKLIGIEVAENERFRVTVEWQYFLKSTSMPKTSTVVYYCNAHENEMQIEMVEYLKNAFTGELLLDRNELDPTHTVVEKMAVMVH